MTDSFPRQSARTRGFNLGLPRAFAVASNGARVAFLRTPAGDDPHASLWVYDVAEDREREVHGPSAADEERLTDEERDRRERAGEKQLGVVTFAADPTLRVAAFVMGDRLLVADLATGTTRELTPAGPAFDPRPDPMGTRVAYVTGGALHVIDVNGGIDRRLAHDDDPDIHWGLAEFVAAEEMGRQRGYWWAPEGTRLLAARVDERPVDVWHIAAPADPWTSPRSTRYPKAGSANADVTLHLLGLDGADVEVRWDRAAFEYLVAVSWTGEGPPLALVQSRDQRDVQVVGIDPDTGATEVLWSEHDDVWTEIVPGTPAWLPRGRLLTAGHAGGNRALMIDGEPVTPPGLEVIGVIDGGEDVVFTATEDPTQVHVWRLRADADPERLSETGGAHGAAVGGDMVVLASETLDTAMPSALLLRDGAPVHTFSSHAEVPVVTTAPTFAALGERELHTAILTPGGTEPDGPLPVLLNPYGGPGAIRVLRTQRAHLESQWLADQGFAVLVTDGRGTPNRGVAWTHAIDRDYVDAALEDQVDALHAAADRLGYLDLSRVGIRGWSYGGYLVLAALLRRPDVFHAGIAGAPVTDMRLYDTHYTERYLGTPTSDAEAYERADVVKDAAALKGDLLMLHGFADDNVYVAHALRMSKALMEAGRLHAMIPLSGITHRPTDERAAEAMLQIQVDFLHRALGGGG